ncbi:MAG: DEAD/DEAH box helicase family protein [Alphaproteobacteria bacterium]|nr:DEAD/DEAH box helicase family protein [Alphaproteobacteria bacterium]
MKLKFKNQDFQTDAVNAAVELFKGQEKANMTFSVADNSAQASFLQNEFGFGNKLLLDEETINSNLHAIQKAHSLPLTDIDGLNAVPLSIEMETGTGKTFVYTKTILELNKRYGFTKFIIVVPSVAIREGVNKSFQVTEEYFKNQYDSVPYRYFIYNSAKLSDVRAFATSSNIEIMIINIDAFKKAENIINQEQDKLNGETAMRYIQDTNPVVIIDEPQSVDNTPKAKEAITSLNPLCVLRYSATHREKQNLVYRLTPVDAYQMGLVKQICVISNAVLNDSNKPYIALKEVSSSNGFSAKIEIDVEDKDAKVTRKVITVKPNDDLFIKSGHRKIYDGYIVAGIDCTKGFEGVEFSNSEYVGLGKAIGSVDENVIKRAQIYQTIKTHLNKELQLFDKGIKVLSLFFIDEVKKYRLEDGSKGIYAQMFEECYQELINSPKYAILKTKFDTDVNKAHNGYFSQDKKGKYKDTKGDTQADDDTYNTIMKDKEWLLSFECPLRFIFSHSALKEGWDNPNVFQVCTLIEQKSLFTCRQKIGRGLRLCVNQDGERIEDKEINVLHVIANESFSEFAEKLQKEIEDETGVKFGIFELDMLIGYAYDEEVEVERTVSETEATAIVEDLQKFGVIDDAGVIKPDVKPEEITFENIPMPEPLKHEVVQTLKAAKPVSVAALACTTYKETVVEKKTFSYEEAAAIMDELKDKKVIDNKGKIKDTMKAQLAAGTLNLSERWSKAAQKAVLQSMNKADNKPIIRDASREVTVKLNKRAIISPEFLELFDKIKQKTTYRVQFDLKKLVADCINDIREMPEVASPRLISQTAKVNVEKSGVSTQEGSLFIQNLEHNYDVLPDILRLISTKTLLKRSTINYIIQESGRAGDFLKNPQDFYEKVLEIIQRNRHKLAIDGIKYIKLAGEEYSVMEIFSNEELTANLDKNAVAVKNSVYDYIIYDSPTVEKPFAVALDEDPDVKMFFKIPSRFKIDTPIGTYNPDWAVYLERNGEQKLYFVLETKGTDDFYGLRPEEQQKIHCGAQHFKALDDVGFSEKPVRSWHEFKKTV